jgi:hypothetical protein
MNRVHARPEADRTSAPEVPMGGNAARTAESGWRAGLMRTLAGWMAACVDACSQWRMGEPGMSSTIVPPSPAQPVSAHPNELDVRRIRRTLENRRRYRYVEPQVIGIAGGYRIESPCCSRNIDPAGGLIDIARLLQAPHNGQWLLQYRDHAQQCWVTHGFFPSLGAALAVLGEDPDRLFWP